MWIGKFLNEHLGRGAEAIWWASVAFAFFALSYLLWRRKQLAKTRWFHFGLGAVILTGVFLFTLYRWAVGL